MANHILKIVLRVALLLLLYLATTNFIQSVGQSLLIGFVASPAISVFADRFADYYFPN